MDKAYNAFSYIIDTYDLASRMTPYDYSKRLAALNDVVPVEMRVDTVDELIHSLAVEHLMSALVLSHPRSKEIEGIHEAYDSEVLENPSEYLGSIEIAKTQFIQLLEVAEIGEQEAKLIWDETGKLYEDILKVELGGVSRSHYTASRFISKTITSAPLACSKHRFSSFTTATPSPF